MSAALTSPRQRVVACQGPLRHVAPSHIGLQPPRREAQQSNRVRRIGVLMPYDENDPLMRPPVSAFKQALAGLGWTDGRNVRMDVRWVGTDINRIRAFAQELVGLRPDIILAGSTPATVALQRETRTIVFAGVGAPVASKMVARLDRPGGNMTGFATFEPPLGGKWLATNSLLVLGQETVDEKSNEITAIPALLERLDVEGALVSIDAMGCNPNIAQSILDAEADYRMTQGWLLDNWHADDGITVA